MIRILVLISLGLWLAALVAGLSTAVLARRRPERDRPALGCSPTLIILFGTLLAFGLVSTAIGVAEGSFRPDRAACWLAPAAGALGAVIAAWGWRTALRPSLAEGCCRRCGYPLAGCTRCPECGSTAES